MRLIDIVRSAVANTFRSKIRTGLTVVAIVIGAFTLTLTTAIGAGVNAYIDRQVASIGGERLLTVTIAPEVASANDGPKPYDPAVSSGTAGIDLLSDDDVAELKATDGILTVEPASLLTPDYIEYRDNGKFALEVNPVATITDADLIAGVQLGSQDGVPEVLLPKPYVDALGFTSAQAAIGETVTVSITDYAGAQHEVDARVTGVQNTSLFSPGAGLNGALWTKLGQLQAIGTPDTVASGYVMAMAQVDPETTPEQVDALQAALRDAGFEGQTVADQIGAIQTVLDGLIGILNAFAGIALIAAGFGIVNTLLMSVQERTREIGLMKAMGMGRGSIFALFSVEAVVIGFLGSAIGAAVAIGLGTALSDLLARTVLSSLSGLTIMMFEPASVAVIVGIVMLIAFLAGTLPAARAARQNPIDALRYE